MKFFAFFVLIFAFLFSPIQLLAESNSSHYILWGSAMTSGGERAISAHYINYASVGDSSANPMDSTNYHQVTGLQALYEEPVLTMNISDNSLTLSPTPLTTLAVSTASTSITISTNADFGYALTVTENTAINNGSGYTLADVSDGTVSAGSEEFGIAVSGDDASFSDDRALTSNAQTIASRNIWGANRQTNITFKAGVTHNTGAGNYTGKYVFIVTGHF